MAPKALTWSLAVAAPWIAWAPCPGAYMGTPPSGHSPVANLTTYNAALDALDLQAVIADVEALLTHSSDCWPADYGNYGPLFVRLAWHCSGSFRNTDGRGGCGGGRQRFSPEKDWEDNANLDHARALLWPIKEKYGEGLSWGDLFITAGSASIKSMGGPVSQFCMGRIDDPDGTSSLDLGPSDHQELVAPCPTQGHCEKPLGSTTVGLIYLNPEGPVMETSPGIWAPNPSPTNSSLDIRDAFGRMGMNDKETVALIGGGHAFGKTHGPCVPANPLAPICGTGKGNDTWTSGFEGPFTTTPTQWGNEFFRVLQEYEWEKHKGPADHWQWRAVNAMGALAKVMRLTSDVALLHDPSYKALVAEFAANQESLDDAFAKAWFKLTTSGGKWALNRRCTGETGTIGLEEADVKGGSNFAIGHLIGVALAGIAVGAAVALGVVAAMRVATRNKARVPSSSDEESNVTQD
mmetsp:Transcript_97152/g.313180  ORF Transcript_97152/g.313180 Transcript_97152/m.313180 type:complete len:463 (+) Transcript_97152:62-1450(+)